MIVIQYNPNFIHTLYIAQQNHQSYQFPINKQINPMKIILHQSIAYFTANPISEDSQITSYIKSHKYYTNEIQLTTLHRQIKQKLSKQTINSSSPSLSSFNLTNSNNNDRVINPSISYQKQKLDQLALYLSTQKNKYMFEIFAIVLRGGSKGVTYKDIDNKVKIGIVSVSHYCCRLKRMNFVELRHQKNQKVVYPKDMVNWSQGNKNVQKQKQKGSTNAKFQEQDEPNPSKKQYIPPFHFYQFSTMDNIWLNISSYQSYIKNGITNQQIKQKLNKTSQTKLIMKMVDQAKDFYGFDREMISEGKVFQNRFKNVTEEILNIDRFVKNQQRNQQGNDSFIEQGKNKKGKMIKSGKDKNVKGSSKNEQNYSVNIKKIPQNNQMMHENIDGQDIQKSNNEQKQKLCVKVQKWLKNKFPAYSSAPSTQKFLFNLINSQLKDYLSALGPKLARRSCTPLKLQRYIKILNSLNQTYPQTHTQLKNYLIQQQKNIPNGTMHKRSIVGMLDGLVGKGVLERKQIQREVRQLKKKKQQNIDSEDEEQQEQEEGNSKSMKQIKKIVETYYFPLWQAQGQEIDLQKKQEQFNILNSMKQKPKKMLFSSLKSSQKHPSSNKISLNQYKNQLKTRLIHACLQQLLLSKLKKAFRNILYTKRSKIVIKMYQPETHIFNILEKDNFKYAPKIIAQNYDSLITKIDQYIEEQGIKDPPIIPTHINDENMVNGQLYGNKNYDGTGTLVNYEVIKMLRKNSVIYESQLKSKFGNNWWQKIQTLVDAGVIEKQGERDGVWRLTGQGANRYFV